MARSQKQLPLRWAGEEPAVPCLFWRPSRFPEETASGSQATAPQAEPDHGWPGPDGLRQGLALGGLGSSQGGLSPGLRKGAMTRAKLKGTWRGPEDWGVGWVWGRGRHQANGARGYSGKTLDPRS